MHNQNFLQGMFSNLQSTSSLKVASQKIHNSTMETVYVEFDMQVTATTITHIMTHLFPYDIYIYIERERERDQHHK